MQDTGVAMSIWNDVETSQNWKDCVILCVEHMCHLRASVLSNFCGRFGREIFAKELEKQLRADGKPATGMSRMEKPRESVRKFKRVGNYWQTVKLSMCWLY